LSSSKATSEEEDEDFENSQANDFACVPANNMDNDTVHIKILDDDPRHMRESHNRQIDDNHHESDMMRSIKILVGGGTGMTVKSSKNEIFDD
jgi:hypothetical protein